MTEKSKDLPERSTSRTATVFVAAVIGGAVTGLLLGMEPWGGEEPKPQGGTISISTMPEEMPLEKDLPKLAKDVSSPSEAPGLASAPAEAEEEQIVPSARPQIEDLPQREQAAFPPVPEASSPEKTAAPGAASVGPENPKSKETGSASVAGIAKAPDAALVIPPPEPRPRSRSAEASLSPREALFDDALGPLLTFKLSGQDIAALKEAIRLFYKNDFEAGKPLLEKIKDRTARKLAYWYYLRASELDASASEIAKFRTENPLWPSKDLLDKRAEYALFMKKAAPEEVFAYFKSSQPQTGAGKAALGAAYLEKGDRERGESLIREAWRKHVLNEDAEEEMLERFGKVLTKQDHKFRADWLLVQDRRSYVAAARRLKKYLDKKDQISLDARAAEVRRSRKAGRLLTRLSKSLKQDPPVLLSRVRWLGRHGKDAKAWSLLRSAPLEAEKLVDPSAWWQVRRVHVRAALNEGHAKTAYAIARDHGGVRGDDLEEAEFLAGWIALRFLNRAEDAKKHFLAGREAADLPKDRARMHYWLGRAELALGNVERATASLREAAKHFHTYYGQLARQALQLTALPADFLKQMTPSAGEIERFRSRDAVRALLIAKQADLESFLPLFLLDLARGLESPGEMILLGELSKRIAPPNWTVRMAKIALNRGFPMEAYAYPMDMPEFKMLSGQDPIEPALLYALTRQESEFDPGAQSRAGARGLMQLMPSTARMVARLHNVKYRRSRLTEPEYNVMLGSAFLRQLLESFDGSYILALAGYNAGPGRVGEWIEDFGDPRSAKIDPVDWVERIPFTETRRYVQKIMESIQVYRALLKTQKLERTLVHDLHRGRPDGAPSPIYAGITN